MTQPSLTPAAFAAKWRGVTTTEKASAQEHFIDLCRMLGEATPHEADPTGSLYAFEKRVSKAGGGDGFADVWKRATTRTTKGRWCDVGPPDSELIRPESGDAHGR
jgi:hypothetical protein